MAQALFVGGEDHEFGMISAVPDTTAGTFDANYARCSLKPLNNVGLVHNFDGDLAAYLAANDTFFYGNRWRGGGGSIGGTGRVVSFYKGLISEFFGIEQFGVADMRPFTILGGVKTYYPQIMPQPGTPIEMSFKIRHHASDGYIRWYQGEILWWEFIGNTVALGDSATTPGRVIWGVPNSNGTAHVSEVIATRGDDSRIGKRLATLYPTADGFHTDMAGGAADVDEIIESALDAVISNAAGQRESFQMSNLPALGAGVIPLDVIISLKGQSTVGSPQNLKGLLRIAGVDYETAAKAIDAIIKNYQFHFPNNPATVGPWDAATINAFEAGATSVA